MCDSYNIVYIDRLMDFSSEENVNIYKKIIKKYWFHCFLCYNIRALNFYD